MSYQTDPLGIIAPKTVETWEWEKVVHGLGLPCVEFQLLETLIKAAIVSLQQVMTESWDLLKTAELSFNASVELLYALFEYQWEGSSRPKELKAILGRCVTAESERNQLIHSN
jgi:hypothetical protein